MTRGSEPSAAEADDDAFDELEHATLRELYESSCYAVNPAAIAPGQRIDRYRLVRLIDFGGFGYVYEAHDPKLDRRVALKVIGELDERDRLDSCLREARNIARVAHPAIVTLYDYGIDEGRAYLAFEMLEGETLESRLARGRMAARDALRVMRQLADTLVYVHEQAGVVHGDIKPANVFLTRQGGVTRASAGPHGSRRPSTCRAPSASAPSTSSASR